MRNSLKYLHFEKFYHIKIIFCIEGASKREGLFAQIATFIGSLEITEDSTDEGVIIPSNPALIEDEDDVKHDNQMPNVWNSCLIIKKGGTRGIEPEDIVEFEGAMAAAMENGAHKSFENVNHIFAFTCTDWMKEAKDNRCYKKLKEDDYEEFSYFDMFSSVIIYL